MFNRPLSALILGASLLSSVPSGRAAAEEIQGQFVLMAELEIDPSQLENFKAAAKENGKLLFAVLNGDVWPLMRYLKGQPEPCPIF